MELIPDDWANDNKNDATHTCTWYVSNLEENRLSIIDSAKFQSTFHQTLQKFPQIYTIQIEESEILEQS